MSRTRHVYPSGNIAHLWANHHNPDAPQHARNPQRNFSFDGDTLYSYRTAIAHIHYGTRDKSGNTRRLVLVSEHRYSNTTAGHLHDARRAFRGDVQVVEVPYVRPDDMANGHATNLHYFRDTITATVAKAKRSRLYKDSELDRALRLFRAARDYCAFFKLSPRKFPPREAHNLAFAAEDCRAEMIAKRAASYAARDARRQARWNRQSQYNYAQNTKSDETRRVEWLSGASNNPPYYGPTLLRKVGDEVQTSRGARVPYAAAINLYRSLKLAQTLPNVRFNIVASRYAIGAFTVEAISGTDVTIGCHVLTYAEIERFARQEGFAAEPALAEPAQYDTPETIGEVAIL